MASQTQTLELVFETLVLLLLPEQSLFRLRMSCQPKINLLQRSSQAAPGRLHLRLQRLADLTLTFQTVCSLGQLRLEHSQLVIAAVNRLGHGFIAKFEIPLDIFQLFLEGLVLLLQLVFPEVPVGLGPVQVGPQDGQLCL